MLGGTVKCPICGAPYKWHAFTVADQSACPACVAEAERRLLHPSDDEIARRGRRRREYFER